MDATCTTRIALLAGLLLMTQAGFRSSLDPYLVPPLLGSVLCVVAALYELRVEEGRAAQRVIAQTEWDLRRTRQRLWATKPMQPVQIAWPWGIRPLRTGITASPSARAAWRIAQTR